MIDIFLLHPGKLVESPYYKYLVNFPPKNCKFVNKKDLKLDYSPKEFFKIKRIKYILKKVMRIGVPSLMYKFESNKYDLIHCAHCIPLNRGNWLVDFEYIWSLAANLEKKHNILHKLIIKKFLSSKSCRKIIPWTYAGAETIKKWYGNSFKEKTEVIYPAIPFTPFKKKKRNKICLIFISRFFYGKGGLIAVEVFSRLLKKYDNVEAKVISNVPESIKKNKKYNKIKFIDVLPHNEIITSVLPQADILIYPGVLDSFGFIFLEAMNFSVPIVTVDGFARKEIVTEEVGFIINRPKKIEIKRITKREKKIIEEMVEKTSILIEKDKLRKRMGKKGQELIKKGKFSIKFRNSNLIKIYEESIKK